VWGNGFVVNLDPKTGTDKVRFVNTGTIRALGEVRRDKTYLLAGGFNNESDTASLAISDEAKPFAASPQTAGTRHECVSCPPGAPDYYFEFPRSEINQILGFHDDGVAGLRVLGNQIEAIKGNRPDITRVHYLIRADEDFRIVGIRFNSTYDSEHRRYEK